LLYTKDQMREECVSWWYEIIKQEINWKIQF
jgi:hypothetical protein